jgi:hypothetical protein
MVTENNRIHLPGGRAGAPNPDAPMLLVCRHCGWVALLPQPLAPVAAQQHDTGCIGPKVNRILELLTPEGE